MFRNLVSNTVVPISYLYVGGKVTIACFQQNPINCYLVKPTKYPVSWHELQQLIFFKQFLHRPIIQQLFRFFCISRNLRSVITCHLQYSKIQISKNENMIMFSNFLGIIKHKIPQYPLYIARSLRRSIRHMI